MGLTVIYGLLAVLFAIFLSIKLFAWRKKSQESFNAYTIKICRQLQTQARIYGLNYISHEPYQHSVIGKFEIFGSLQGFWEECKISVKVNNFSDESDGPLALYYIARVTAPRDLLWAESKHRIKIKVGKDHSPDKIEKKISPVQKPLNNMEAWNSLKRLASQCSYLEINKNILLLEKRTLKKTAGSFFNFESYLCSERELNEWLGSLNQLCQIWFLKN